MSQSQINPTRMELMKLKSKLTMSIRGHKLLKDKQDELIHRFIDIVYETKKLREDVDLWFSDILKEFTKMKEKLSLVQMYEMIMIPSSKIDISYKYQSIMGIEIPKINIDKIEQTEYQTYSDITSPMEIEEVKSKMTGIFSSLILLAEKEQSIYLMSEDIAKTRRRVNVIENVMIPDLKDDIKRITMKLEDNERSNTIRIMKSKEIVLEKINQERLKRRK